MSWQSGPAHTDSTLLLTPAAGLRSKHTCEQAWVLKIGAYTQERTQAQVMDKVHILLDSPPGRLLTCVTPRSGLA